MKKLSAFLAALLLALSLCAGVPALAADSDFPEPPWGNIQDMSVYVNGEYDPDHVQVVYDMDNDTHTFTYIGAGDVTGWEFPWAVENTDYIVLARGGDSITLRFINADHGIPYINVLVGTKTTATTAPPTPGVETPQTTAAATKSVKTTAPARVANGGTLPAENEESSAAANAETAAAAPSSSSAAETQAAESADTQAADSAAASVNPLWIVLGVVAAVAVLAAVAVVLWRRRQSKG